MRNTLKDLNNYLFEQIEILNDSDTLHASEERFERTLKVAKAKEAVCQQIIELNKLTTEQAKLMAEYGGYEKAEMLMIGSPKK